MSNNITKNKSIKDLMNKDTVQKNFQKLLGSKSQNFVTSVVNTTMFDNTLSKCPPKTILSSAVIAATLDLPIDKNLGFSAIVPYYNNRTKQFEASFQMMYKGFVQLAIRSGQYKNILVETVYKDEIKSYNPFKGEVEFTPHEEWEIRYKDEVLKEEIAGFYAYFKLMNGFEKVLYIDLKSMEKHARKYSNAYKNDIKKNWTSSMWSSDFESMGKKTALKQLISKFGLMSIEMQEAVLKDTTITRGGGAIEYVDNQKEIQQEVEEKANSKEINFNKAQQEVEQIEVEIVEDKKENKEEEENGDDCPF